MDATVRVVHQELQNRTKVAEAALRKVTVAFWCCFREPETKGTVMSRRKAANESYALRRMLIYSRLCRIILFVGHRMTYNGEARHFEYASV